jgi:DNA uptake protein ComE-like DNA-binding protein
MMKFFKEFFYYSKLERRGVLLMILLIILGIALIHKINHSAEVEVVCEDSLTMMAVDTIAASVKRVERINRRGVVSLRTFDPNTADSATFVSLGLRPWMASNIMKYRLKGGRFRRVEDFAKVYGLSTGQFDTLRPYIVIADDDKSEVKSLIIEEHRDTVYKYPEGTLLPINSSDTTELKKIPGVGSGIAKMIVGYRNRLGGYYSLEQLSEIHLRVDILRNWLVMDSVTIRRININRSGVDYMRHHPYINFYQAKAIREYRKRNGDIRSLNTLRMMSEFSEADIDRLSHYIRFTDEE